MPIISLFDVCLFGAGLYIVKRLLDARRQSAPLPPGPMGWPIVGSLFDIPLRKNWETFAALGKKYGTYTLIV